VGGRSAAALGQSETPNHVSDGGSFRRKRPWRPMPARHQLRGSDRSRARPAFRRPGRRGILSGMSTRPRSEAGPPMTLGNMRANGVRSLTVSCWQCHHRAVLSADPWPDHVPVPSFGPRMVCTSCGIVGADARTSLAGAGTVRYARERITRD
jgi:hypothetical protein